jgi:hypothetical protein
MTRDLVVSQLQRAAPIEINGNAELVGTALTGHITVQGPVIGSEDEPDLKPLVVQVIIAERGVVFHGSSGVVIHRMLARGLATTGPRKGVAYLPDDDGRLEFNFARDLSDIESENSRYLDQLEEGQTRGGTRMGLRIEPGSVEVVVVVRDARSGEVVQTRRCELRRKEAAR